MGRGSPRGRGGSTSHGGQPKRPRTTNAQQLRRQGRHMEGHWWACARAAWERARKAGASGCMRQGRGGGGFKGSRYLQSSHRHTVLHAPHRVVVHDPGHYGALGDRHCLGLEARILARAVGRGSDDKRGGEKNASLNKQAPQHGTRRTTPSNGTPIPRITLL